MHIFDITIRMWYITSMNERDPITEWGNAIKHRLGSAAVIIILFAFVCCLVAPAFSPWIKHMKRKEYVLYHNYEQRAEEDMKGIRVLLWIVAIIAWIILFYANLC